MVNFRTLDKIDVQVVPGPQEEASLNNPEDWDNIYLTDDEDFYWMWVVFVMQSAGVAHQDAEISRCQGQ